MYGFGIDEAYGGPGIDDCFMRDAATEELKRRVLPQILLTKMFEYCASEAMQIFGRAGYLRGNPVERVYREAKVMAIGGGSEEIMKDLAIRQMGPAG